MAKPRKYGDEYEEAAHAMNTDSMPHKIYHDEPRALAHALRNFLQRNKIRGVGISNDKDGIWIRWWRRKK